jgi:hypothetical protein
LANVESSCQRGLSMANLNQSLKEIKMKDDYNDIYFVLIIGIASFLVILGTGIYSTLRYGSF